ADQLAGFVADPLKEALAPVKARTPGPAAPRPQHANCSGAALTVRFGDGDVSVACDEDSLLGFVGLAWLTGGFPAVVRARQALDDAIDGLADAAAEKRRNAGAVSRKLASEQDLPATPTRDYIISSLQEAANRTGQEAKDASTAADKAIGCRTAFSNQF